MSAVRCEGCQRVGYDVQRVALLVSGQLRAERDLCPACRVNTVDSFLVARDGVPLPKVAR